MHSHVYGGDFGDRTARSWDFNYGAKTLVWKSLTANCLRKSLERSRKKRNGMKAPWWST